MRKILASYLVELDSGFWKKDHPLSICDRLSVSVCVLINGCVWVIVCMWEPSNVSNSMLNVNGVDFCCMVLFQCHLSQYFPAGQPDIDTTERNTIYSPVTCNTTHTLTVIHSHRNSHTQTEKESHLPTQHPHTHPHTYKHRLHMRFEQIENDTWT